MPERKISVREAAAEYIERGYQVVPLSPGTKAPDRFKDWISLVFKAEDFHEDDNIGLRNINGLVDVDCDAPEAVKFAPRFLPKTGAVYGRFSKPSAHWLYLSEFEKKVDYKDLCSSEKGKATLIEIRVNHQSMAPPSIHPVDEELIDWEGGFGHPEEIPSEDLHRAVRLVATAAMMARHYPPPGNRHDWGLAVAGSLHQFGVTEDECNKLFLAAGDWAHDTDLKNRLDAVRSTYSRSTDDPLKAFGELIEIMPKGKDFVKTLNVIWGSASTSFVLNAKGDAIVKDSQENVKRALEKLNVKLTFDQFDQKPYIEYNGYKGELEDPIRNRLWLEIDKQFHFRPSAEFFDVVIQDLAYANPRHPVREYLQSLVWDGTPRIDTWLIRSAGAADAEYTRAVSSIVLIAAVRRIMHPGCKFDELLVLESAQGKFKSSMLRMLCPNETWFSDDLPLNVEAKQIIERTTGKWIIEAAELSGMRASQTEHLKALLSRQEDGPVRMAYARMPRSQKRQFIVVGTTNSHNYLDDPTGNRRFWPIRVEEFNLALIRKERDQLWAEATFREARGDSIRLRPDLHGTAAIQQERRRTEHPWEPILSRKFGEIDGFLRIHPDEIWNELGIPIERRTAIHQKQVIQIMQQLGFRRMSVRDKLGKVAKGWGKGRETKELMIRPEEYDEYEKYLEH